MAAPSHGDRASRGLGLDREFARKKLTRASYPACRIRDWPLRVGPSVLSGTTQRWTSTSSTETTRMLGCPLSARITTTGRALPLTATVVLQSVQTYMSVAVTGMARLRTSGVPRRELLVRVMRACVPAGEHGRSRHGSGGSSGVANH